MIWKSEKEQIKITLHTTKALRKYLQMHMLITVMPRELKTCSHSELHVNKLKWYLFCHTCWYRPIYAQFKHIINKLHTKHKCVFQRNITLQVLVGADKNVRRIKEHKMQVSLHHIFSNIPYTFPFYTCACAQPPPPPNNNKTKTGMWGLLMTMLGTVYCLSVVRLETVHDLFTSRWQWYTALFVMRFAI